MPASNHGRSPAARLALAIAALAALVALAAAAQLAAGIAGGARGTFAGVLLIGAVSAGCGLAFRPRAREPKLTRPAPTALPDRSGEGLEPVKSAA